MCLGINFTKHVHKTAIFGKKITNRQTIKDRNEKALRTGIEKGKQEIAIAFVSNGQLYVQST